MKTTIQIDRPARPRTLITVFSLTAEPAEQLSLTVDRKGEAGVLTLQAPMDCHEGNFILEHSSDGILWQVIESRNLPGEGTTSVHTYQFAKGAPETGINYYRLQHIAPDGHLLWSKAAILAFFPAYNLSWYTIDKRSVKVEVQDMGREKYRLAGMDGSVRWGLLQNGRATLPLPVAGKYELEVITAAGSWKRMIDVPFFFGREVTGTHVELPGTDFARPGKDFALPGTDPASLRIVATSPARSANPRGAIVIPPRW